MQFKLKKGLDLPITGVPEQRIHDAPPVQHVAVVGADYIDLKPTMRVAEGDRVKRGQPLFEHKKLPGVLFTAPAGGEVVAIHRGARRALQSVVIRIDAQEEAEAFTRHDAASLDSLAPETVVEQMCAAGLWPMLRQRPFAKIPDPQSRPAAIIVPAMDTNPLAPDMSVVLAAQAEDFAHGLRVLARLTDGKVWVTTAPGSDIPLPEGAPKTVTYP